MRLRSFRKKVEAKALQKRKMKPLDGALERRLSLRCVRKTSTEEAYGLVHSVTVLTTR